MLLRPVAFKIENFKAIRDSGKCSFSGDGITALAGQNEAGKSSVLQALFDFDSKPGLPSKRSDYKPDHSIDSIPRVSVKFEFDPAALFATLEQALEKRLYPAVCSKLEGGQIWISRTLEDGEVSLGEGLSALFKDCEEAQSLLIETAEPPSAEDDSEEAELIEDYYCTEEEFALFLYKKWPSFVYFDSFEDLLPRKIAVDKIQKLLPGGPKVEQPEIGGAAADFLKIAGIDLDKVMELAELDDEDKQLRNYLAKLSAEISGDFQDYWKQRLGGNQVVKLQAEFTRKRDGSSYLVFYAHDGSALQFPDQRSKGFLWFLSFYLRLAASVSASGNRQGQLVLVDEPGSFLHPKAQRDILDILERRIVKKEDMVLYSTHSPYLLPPDKLHRVRIAFRLQNGESVVADRLTDPRLQKGSNGDAISPVLAAIGMEVDAQLSSVKRENIIVEGISDYYYVHAWAKLLKSDLLTTRGVVVAKGTPNIPHSVSLCLAWSQRFVILLDRDEAGDKAAAILQKDMDISPRVIVQPSNAITIEDLFSPKDFQLLISRLDERFKLEQNETPSSAIERQNIDKVLLARTFAEAVSKGDFIRDTFTDKSTKAAEKLFESLVRALGENAVFKVS